MGTQRQPGRRRGADVAVDEHVPAAVPGNHSQCGAGPVSGGQVGDPDPGGRPANVGDRRVRRERPAHGPVRLDCAEHVARDGGNEEAARRPGRLRVPAEQTAGAVGLDHPGPLRRADQQSPAARDLGQGRLRVVDADRERFVDPVAHLRPGRGEEQGGEQCRGRKRERQARPSRPLGAVRLALLEGRLRQAPAAALRLLGAGDRRLPQQRSQAILVHRSASPSRSPSRSRARRSRELTVPRGSSSMRPISPGL